MRPVYTDILLINSIDEVLVNKKMLNEEDVRRMTVKLRVDTGMYMTGITEDVQKQLKLPFIEKRKIMLADKSIKEFDVVGPLTMKFKNRLATCNALVLQGSEDSVLGTISIGEMDVLIHPQLQELVVNPEHPCGAQLSMK